MEFPSTTVTSVPHSFTRLDTISGQYRGREEDIVRKQLAMGAFRADSQEFKCGIWSQPGPQNVQNIWAILPGFPMMFWKKEILEAIGDQIDKFVALEGEWEKKVCQNSNRIGFTWWTIWENSSRALWGSVEIEVGLLKNSISMLLPQTGCPHCAGLSKPRTKALVV